MKNRLKLMPILLAILLIISSCRLFECEDENHHKTIRFINNLNVPLYISPSNLYPDTLCRRDVEGLVSQYRFYKVDPNEENSRAFRLQSFYEDVFRYGKHYPSDTLIVFVIDAQLLELEPKADAAYVNKAIIQRYYLSLADLKYLNWKLTYPPTSEMSVVKMYPPYKQQDQ